MIEIAHEWTENHGAKNRIEFRVGSAEDLPVARDFADTVLAFDSIDHWQDVDRGLHEVRRILQSDGKFVIIKDRSVPNAQQAMDTLITRLESAGFVIRDKRQINADDVSFNLLVCEMDKV
jgi:ubiquinone/menaquinone biosynthesis C-methylase UbiE